MTELQSLSGLPDKRLVAASFSRAAASYDSVAALQRVVGQQLLDSLPTDYQPASWLDMGCGTGFFSRALAARYPQAIGSSLDIAEGMLGHARDQGGARYFIGGDAEALPLIDASQELIFSSLAVQWCGDFSSVLAEAQRVLTHSGIFAFSSLCTGTLKELRNSWQAVDARVHVNRFREFAAYQALCSVPGWRVAGLQVQPHVLHFADLRQLTHELKALGAHNLNPGRPEGLTGRARIRALVEAYEEYRQPEGLPATYQVVYGLLRKDC